jgi:phosphohistidine phosphatase
VLFVGHNPGLERFAVRLAGGGNGKSLDRLKRKYPTAALAEFRFEAERWGDIAEGAGCLVRFVRPKDLA